MKAALFVFSCLINISITDFGLLNNYIDFLN
ncbi:hypothetical protein ABID99_001676 [Mucilaginibacter sp. OAE612]